MAYLTTTLLNDLQAKEASNEKIFKEVGQLGLALDSTKSVDYVPPSVQEKLATLPGNMLAKIPVLKDQTVTVVTTPGFNQIPSNLGETDAYSFTAYDVFSGFRFYPASFESNQMDANFYKEQILKNVLNAMAVTVDGIINTNLVARKTQVFTPVLQISQGDGAFTWNAGTSTLEVAKAAVKEALFFNVLEGMRAMGLGGDYRIVTSPAAFAVNQMLANELGPNAAKNLAWAQAVIPQDRRYISNQLSAGSDIFSGYMVRDGAIGVYENFPWDFRNGVKIAGKEWSISDVKLPYVGMRANVYINSEATDATALVEATDSNMIMTHFEEMALWLRFYVVYRYNSAIASRPNDIVKIEGKTT
jgi:hypothetical protein